MSGQREGRRFTRGAAGLGLVLAGALSGVGCADSAAQSPAPSATGHLIDGRTVDEAAGNATLNVTPNASPVVVEARGAMSQNRATERVVQRLSPTDPSGAAPAASAAAVGPASPAEQLPATSASSAGVSGSETITPRHVEAELNRLEAELAN